MWAATASSYCPSRAGELPKHDEISRTMGWETLYIPNISFPGECEDGFRSDVVSDEVNFGGSREICVPIDVCAEENNVELCHSNATCVSNGPGTHHCLCDDGFEGDGYDDCTRKHVALTDRQLLHDGIQYGWLIDKACIYCFPLVS